MNLPLFKLEDYFAKWEFTAPYSLCFSDAETVSMHTLLGMGDIESHKLWETLELGYTETQGHPLLRQEVAKHYMASPDQLLITAGAEEAIFASVQALIEPGDHVICIKPCYGSLATLPEVFGAEISEVFLDHVNGWRLDLENLKKTFRSNTKLLVLNYPHSPTGALITAQALSTIVELARSVGAYIFCDEVYRLLEFDETKRLCPIADLYEKGISLSVMSKAYGLAGLRIGWLATRDASFLARVKNSKHYLSICNSAPSEILALIALRNFKGLIDRNLTIIKENLAKLEIFFVKYANLFSWHAPQAGCTGFVKLLIDEPIDTFVQELLAKAGILLLPGTAYDYVGPYFRLGFARKSMPKALLHFEHFIQENYS